MGIHIEYLFIYIIIILTPAGYIPSFILLLYLQSLRLKRLSLPEALKHQSEGFGVMGGCGF